MNLANNTTKTGKAHVCCWKGNGWLTIFTAGKDNCRQHLHQYKGEFFKITYLFSRMICTAKKALVFAVFFSSLFSYGQDKHVVDSLQGLLRKPVPDTSRAEILFALAQQFYVSNPDSSLQLGKEGLKISEKIYYKKGIVSGCGWLGYIYQAKGQVKRALEFFFRSLKIQEEIGDKEGMPVILNNIGYIYFNQGENEKALQYWQNALKLFSRTSDKISTAYTLNNIGYVYYMKRNVDSAIVYYNQSLKLREEAGDQQGIAGSLINIGSTYRMREDLTPALEYYRKALAIYEKTQDKGGVARAGINIGAVLIKQNKFGEAKKYCRSSLDLSMELGYPDLINESAEMMRNICKHEGNYKMALEMFELAVKMNDSIHNEETRKAGMKNQLKYEYEKKAAADSIKNVEQQKVTDAQLAAQTATLKQEKFQRYSLVAGLTLVICGLAFVVNRFRITRKQKKIIEEQKTKVDEAFDKLEMKQKEIIDSIHYAKRIQRALITSENNFEKMISKLRSRQ